MLKNVNAMKNTGGEMFYLHKARPSKTSRSVTISFLSILGLAPSFLFIACSNDEPEPRSIQLQYQETQINNTFRAEGSVAPSFVDWTGQEGVFSISSPTELLQRNVVVFDTLTGVLSWGKSLPLGAFNFTISAISGNSRTDVELVIKNTFEEGFFSGGFLELDLDVDEINFANVEVNYGLWLYANGTLEMEKYDNPLFSASGEWRVIEANTFSISFITNFSGGILTFLNGSLYNAELLPEMEGLYGSAIQDNLAIENPTGIFRFEWD